MIITDHQIPILKETKTTPTAGLLIAIQTIINQIIIHIADLLAEIHIKEVKTTIIPDIAALQTITKIIILAAAVETTVTANPQVVATVSVPRLPEAEVMVDSHVLQEVAALLPAVVVLQNLLVEEVANPQY